MKKIGNKIWNIGKYFVVLHRETVSIAINRTEYFKLIINNLNTYLMKKRLLLALAFIATALTGFAQSAGDFVNAVQGRYQLVGENLLPNGTFVDGFAGWASLNEATAIEDVFGYDAEKGGIVSILNANTEGIYSELKGLNAGATYVVSFTIASNETLPNQSTLHNSGDVTPGANLIDIIGSSTGTIAGSEEAPVVSLAKATEIFPGEAQVYSQAFKAEALTYFIKLAGVDANLTIKNITVYEANEYADFRKAEGILDWAKKIKDAYAWEESDEYTGLVELIGVVEDLMENPEATAEEFDSAVLDLQAGIDDFTKAQMDDFLPNAIDKLPMSNAKVQKASSIGIWKDYGATGRIHAGGNDTSASNPAYYDLGHYAGSTAWGGGALGLGLQTSMTLQPGVYVFSVNLMAACRENAKSSCWTNNSGLSFADGELYVNLMAEDGTVAEERVATTGKYVLSPSEFKRNTVVLKVETAGTYQFCMNTTPKEGYEGIKQGSVAYPYQASIYAKTAEKYTKAQLDYEVDVREQITAGRDNITKATERLADEAKSWGKDALKAVVDEFTPAIENYEAMSQDEVIATFDAEVYDKSKGLEALTDDESTYYRLLASEVYRSATKQLIAGVKAFDDQNAVIDALTTAIASAEETYNARIYNNATGKADFKAAIDAAKTVETAMRADDYSEDNVTTVNDAIATLNEAATTFKTTIPADKMTTVIDIDFANAPVLNEESQLYEIAGAKGTMILPNYTPSEEAADNNYSKGFYDNGELVFGDLLRVGAGDATVDFSGVASDAIVVLSLDLYYGALSGKSAGFYLRNAAAENVSGFSCSKYSGTSSYNPFNINFNSNIAAVGAQNQNNHVLIAAESNKTNFNVVLDLAAKTMTCTTSGSKGTFTTETVAMENEDVVPTQFVLNSDYNNNERRCWFDNLKIVTVDAGEYDGIKNVNAANAVVAPVKALVNGQVVIKTAKGTFTAAGAQVK